MALTVLQLVTEFTDKMGLPTPSGIVGATEKSAKQYLAALKALLRDMTQYRWPQQRITVVFNATGVLYQGNLGNMAGTGPDLSIVKDTFWSTDKQVPVTGPLTPAAYQTMLNLGTTGPEYNYYLAGVQLYILPIPPAGEAFSLFVETPKGVVGSNGVYKETPTDDSDTFLYPDRPMMLGFEYHWLRIKGEQFEDAYNDFIGAVAVSKAALTGPTLQMDSQPMIRRPGIYIPPGNWSV